MEIAFYLQDGVEVLDFAGPMEVFNYAGFDVFTVSEHKEIKSQGILTIKPDYLIDNAPKADILAFFGGNSEYILKSSNVIKWIQAQSNIKYYFSVCTGVFYLAYSGILSGQKATTFHEALERLEREHTDITVIRNARFVDNGHIITTAGISAGIDGALHLVAKIINYAVARKVAYYMEYDKWQPGEGLLLGHKSVYQNLPSYEELKEYEGNYYASINEKQLYIQFNHREKGLELRLNQMRIPILYLDKEKMEDASGRCWKFDRNNDGSILNCYAVKEPDIIFQKVGMFRLGVH